ncbi:MAG: hypothetical protein ACTHOC_01300, partial [Luteimonas sp.]
MGTDSGMRVSLRPVLFLAFALLPIYLWASGGLQISHYLLMLYCLVFLANNGLQAIKADIILLMVFVVVLLREAVA